MEIIARNVHEALGSGLEHLFDSGELRTSRNGPVLVAPEPVLTVYRHPQQRVLLSPTRDANPFFHLMEALWMLGGREDLAWPLNFNSRFSEYSDDGKVISGAYGFRWRKYFGRDQLSLAIKELKENPESRRVVVAMWSPNDLGRPSRDLPCNTHIYFSIHDGALNMTVNNRSNDALWGAYGANAVHFSILMEYVAAAVNVKIGTYYQFSNNLHVYTDILSEEKARAIIAECGELSTEAQITFPLVLTNPLIGTDIEAWDRDLGAFLRRPDDVGQKFQDPFFKMVAAPMFLAWKCRQAKDYYQALDVVSMIAAPDWRMACKEWLERRIK